MTTERYAVATSGICVQHRHVCMLFTEQKGLLWIGEVYLSDQVDALRRCMGDELRDPYSLLRCEVEVHVRSSIPLELTQHLLRGVSKDLSRSISEKIRS